jgi:hypothetical protein
MSRTATEVILHTCDYLVARGIGIFQQQAVGIHNHSGGTEAALQRPKIHERLLQGMELSVAAQSFNSDDFLVANFANLQLARPDGLVVDDHGARATEALTAAKLGSGQPQIRSQHPEERSVTIDIQGGGFAIESEIDGFRHIDTLEESDLNCRKFYQESR